MTVHAPLTAMLGAFLIGCVSLYPVESTPEGILRSISPGDTVKITTRDGSETTLQVRLLSEFDIRGRLNDHDGEMVAIPFERIERIEVERLDLRKAMLTTVLPAVVGIVVLCNHKDCESQSVITTTP